MLARKLLWAVSFLAPLPSLAIAPSLATAQPIEAAEAEAPPDAVALARLDGFVMGLTSADQFSGVVLVAYGDDILFEKAYGPIDAAAETPATIDTRYNLASAGKMFTSVAILQQIAAGRLTLDTSVGEVLTDYENREFADAVTVRHLLTHTAGAGGIDELFGRENAASRANLRTHAAMVALHDDRPPAWPPGTRQEYDNFGFVVLGRMVEVLSGQDFESYVEQHIFAPAGMTHTSFVDCTERAADLAMGYEMVDGERHSNCGSAPTRGFAAGGEVSTARDMHRFVRALQTGRLISPELFAEATRTHEQFMGLGFFATDYGPDIPARDFRWGHGGSHPGINADIRAYPRTGEIVIILSNRDAPVAHAVAAFLHDNDGENPTRSP